MSEPRPDPVHLRKPSNPYPAACGSRTALGAFGMLFTVIAADVTCRACKRTIYYRDIAAAQDVPR